MNRLFDCIIAVLFALLVIGIIQYNQHKPDRYHPVKARYLIIHILEREGGTEVYTTEREVFRFAPCSTDLECYEVCIEAGGDPDWCEQGLMEGGKP